MGEHQPLTYAQMGEVAGAVAKAIMDTVGDDRAQEVVDRWAELGLYVPLGFTCIAAVREAMKGEIRKAMRR
ncbi:hypothetical protein FF100_04915 [Methylobacterium terricola]|uniref:Uncharacterized protein n=1 Tax=Methylobacterium terricola TaxID=2583531 RepID=A0A5C4LNA1_9HYPH|nr:hypothetical protein [Methylobacterium terricola]TNC14919.1 hypothetical protein FF100_04915 [Methylobacterium terricola]